MVVTTQDTGAGSLRQAIADANDGDTIRFSDRVRGTITLSSELMVAKNLTIAGPGLDQLTVSGNCSDRVLEIAASVSLSGLTIANGCAHGRGPSGLGGGVLNYGTLTISNCVITGNSATIAGGGISNLATMTIVGSVIDDNATLTDNSCSQGETCGAGGIDNSGTLTLVGSTVAGNTTPFAGGGIASNPGAWLTITNSTVSNNTAGSDRSCTADTCGGGGIAANGGLEIRNSVIAHNHTGLVGGGIANSCRTGVCGTVTLTNSTVSDNQSGLTGGGIDNTGSLVLANSTVSGNSAQHGGGIANSCTGGVCIATLANCTVTGNSASGGGGGIANDCNDTLCPITELRNTVIAGNSTGGDCAAPSTIASQGYNLDSDGSCGLTGAGDLSQTDQKLGPLTDNGGLTPTHALFPDSPAIDAGNPTGCIHATGAPLTTDQRNYVRPIDGKGRAACDIGAYEFASHPASCDGDCRPDGRVTRDDTLAMVSVALGATPLNACQPGDVNRDSTITVDEILTAVNNALSGCGETGTAAPPPKLAKASGRMPWNWGTDDAKPLEDGFHFDAP